MHYVLEMYSLDGKRQLGAEMGSAQLSISTDNWEGGLALSVFYGADDGLAQLGATQTGGTGFPEERFQLLAEALDGLLALLLGRDGTV